jgi:hypothetical protein
MEKIKIQAFRPWLQGDMNRRGCGKALWNPPPSGVKPSQKIIFGAADSGSKKY